MRDCQPLKLVRVYADGAGETHLADLRVPDGLSGSGATTRVLRDVPTTTLNISESLERRRQMGPHAPPRRQLGVVLRGEFEITTTDGDSRRFGPGDCVLADDMESKGHTYEDVGQEPLITVTIGLPTDWKWPE